MAQMVTERSLKRDISTYKRLKNKDFSQKVYYQQEEILDKATEILQLYSQDQLDIQQKDYPALAEYIDVFGGHEKDKLLNKLQSVANFDIHLYLRDKSKTLWQRLFHRNEAPVLKAEKMKSDMKKYTLLSKQTSKNFKNYILLSSKIDDLQNKAYQNIQSVADGKLEVMPQDFDLLKQYIQMFIPYPHETSVAFQALQKISTYSSQTSKLQQAKEHSKSKVIPLHPSHIKTYGSFHSSIWMRMGKKLSSIFHRRHNKPKNRISVHNLWNRIKVPVITATIVIGSALGLKFGSNHVKTTDTLSSKDTPTILTNNSSQSDYVKPTIVYTAPKSKSENIQKPEKNKSAQKATNDRIWKNYYDTTIDIVAPTLKIDKEKLYAQINNQIKKGIFTLPEGITAEKLALNYVMFKAYGLNSSIDIALKANTKLSVNAQHLLNHDAGIKQTEIKNIAKKKYGRLSSYSAYDHASKDLRNKHVTNLKELRKIKNDTNRQI